VLLLMFLLRFLAADLLNLDLQKSTKVGNERESKWIEKLSSPPPLIPSWILNPQYPLIPSSIFFIDFFITNIHSLVRHNYSQNMSTVMSMHQYPLLPSSSISHS
jgi:hypothetical protein